MDMLVLPQSTEWDCLLGSDFIEIDQPDILIAARKLAFPDGTFTNISTDIDAINDVDYDQIFNATQTDAPELFEKAWGEPEITSDMDEFKKYFFEHSEFLVKTGYTKEERSFMNKTIRLN